MIQRQKLRKIHEHGRLSFTTPSSTTIQLGPRLLRVLVVLLRLYPLLLCRSRVDASFWVQPLSSRRMSLGGGFLVQRSMFGRTSFVSALPLASWKFKSYCSAATTMTANSRKRLLLTRSESKANLSSSSSSNIPLEETLRTENISKDEKVNHKDGPELNSKTMTLYIFQHPNIIQNDKTRAKVYGVGISLAQFRQFVLYRYPDMIPSSDNDTYSTTEDKVQRDYERTNVVSYISSKEINVMDPQIKQHLRELWYEQNLIVHKTDVISIYPSESIQINRDANDNGCGTYKRGGAYDMVSSYSDRLMGVWKEELELERIKIGPKTNDSSEKEFKGIMSESSSSCNVSLSPYDLKQWLEHSYGSRQTQLLEYDFFLTLSNEEQKDSIQQFLIWFKSNFPYYYDRCPTCHSSYKEEKDSNKSNETCSSETSDYDNEESEESDHEELDGTFLGYLYPNENELLGKATRTELYQCHVCHEYYRFPRFNALQHIISHGKGRCGEYSILLYRIMRSLGHQVRWVVDWSDHVWTELRLGDNWVHMDPCEAAFNKPLLYKEWGKVQTYIVAFWIPSNRVIYSTKTHNFPFIEDVTYTYTSDTSDEIQKRREEDVMDIIRVIQTKMQIELENLTLHSRTGT